MISFRLHPFSFRSMFFCKFLFKFQKTAIRKCFIITAIRYKLSIFIPHVSNILHLELQNFSQSLVQWSVIQSLIGVSYKAFSNMSCNFSSNFSNFSINFSSNFASIFSSEVWSDGVSSEVWSDGVSSEVWLDVVSSKVSSNLSSSFSSNFSASFSPTLWSDGVSSEVWSEGVSSEVWSDGVF